MEETLTDYILSGSEAIACVISIITFITFVYTKLGPTVNLILEDLMGGI